MSKLGKLSRMPLLLAIWACSSTETVQRDVMRTLDLSPADRAGVRQSDSALRSTSDMLYALGAPEVRTVFYYRLRHGSFADQLMRFLLQRLYPGQVGVEIRCRDIGPGFVLGHGQCSIIWARKIGCDCTIYQHVTVGLKAGESADRAPVLGDRVWIWGGAMIIGSDLGDDVTVGAASVVLHDVPSGATAVGAPARLLGPELALAT